MSIKVFTTQLNSKRLLKKVFGLSTLERQRFISIFGFLGVITSLMFMGPLSCSNKSSAPSQDGASNTDTSGSSGIPSIIRNISTSMPLQDLKNLNISEVQEYCTTVNTFSPSVTITGTATYQAREVSLTGLGAPGAPQVIPHAEVRVVDSSGTVVQCSQTDESGNLSFTVPTTATTLKVQVLSRANNDYVKVSVLKPDSSTPHYIEASFVVSSNIQTLNIGNINAPATGTLEGGAFNIYKQIWKANQFLRIQTASCDGTSCTPLTVAKKVIVFWKKGFNPGSYYNYGLLSFYVPEYKSLFVLGGDKDKTDYLDTDHFDNSIIIHEYAHFLEHMYAKTDSPGGSHDGNSVIDPRLAWGEGWADFFQAAVTGNAVYQDSVGNIDGDTLFYFNENLETAQHDIPSTPGEGNFHEFSITRALWALIHPATGSTALPFSELWSTFTNTTFGFASSSLYFRSIGLFYEVLLSLDKNAHDISSVITRERQEGSRKDYGRPLSLNAQGTCDDFQIIGEIDSGALEDSNQYTSNDFYQITHSGGDFVLQLIYTQVNATRPTDLDLYLYNDGYVFGDESTMAGKSAQYYGEKDIGTETLNLTAFSAGTYMINVHVLTKYGVGAGAKYHLMLNGVKLCP